MHTSHSFEMKKLSVYHNNYSRVLMPEPGYSIDNGFASNGFTSREDNHAE